MRRRANPLNRGSSPGRARDASQRSGSFELGHKKLGGRKKGTRNSISPEHKRAILEAAHRVGRDGNGTDGVAGYFSWVATRYRAFFLIDIWSHFELEVHEAVLGRRSRQTKKPRPFEPLSERPGGEVQELMRLAVEQPKGFCKIFRAAWLGVQSHGVVKRV